jgi:hypothetical protein
MRSIGNPAFSFLCKVDSILIIMHKVDVSSLDLVVSQCRPDLAPS